MKAIRWLLKLVLTMITLPLILAVWLIKWFVVFLHHCSAWTFYLLGSVVLATAVLSFLMQQSQGIEALQMLIGGFVIFMIPQLPERCLSRKAGIVRYCLWKKVVQDLISGGLHCLWGRVNPLRRTPQLVAIFGRRNAV